MSFWRLTQFDFFSVTAEGGENMILRKSIYLVILSSEGFEDCAQKLQRMRLNPGEETKLCNIILDCCCGQRKYEKFFQLLVKVSF